MALSCPVFDARQNLCPKIEAIWNKKWISIQTKNEWRQQKQNLMQKTPSKRLTKDKPWKENFLYKRFWDKRIPFFRMNFSLIHFLILSFFSYKTFFSNLQQTNFFLHIFCSSKLLICIHVYTDTYLHNLWSAQVDIYNKSVEHVVDTYQYLYVFVSDCKYVLWIRRGGGEVIETQYTFDKIRNLFFSLIFCGINMMMTIFVWYINYDADERLLIIYQMMVMVSLWVVILQE